MNTRIVVISLLLLFVTSCTPSQTTNKVWTTPVPVEPSKASVVDGKFTSESGRFSISIAEMPMKTMDYGSEKVRANGLDAGKQYIWQFPTTMYTVMYDTFLDDDGKPDSPKFDDMVIGSRKGVLNSNGKIVSEKPFTNGEFSGTELRYISAQNVNYIGRIFLADGRGYAVTGGYVDGHEKEVLDVLNSFTITSAK